jgi:hypothetical protein
VVAVTSCPGRSRDEDSHDLSFRVVLPLKDKAPPEAVTFFNPLPNGTGLLPLARLLSRAVELG